MSRVAPESVSTEKPFAHTILIIEDTAINTGYWYKLFFGKKIENIPYDKDGIFESEDSAIQRHCSKIIIATKWSDALGEKIKELNAETDVILLDQTLETGAKQGRQIFDFICVVNHKMPVIAVSNEEDFCLHTVGVYLDRYRRDDKEKYTYLKWASLRKLNEKIDEARVVASTRAAREPASHVPSFSDHPSRPAASRAASCIIESSQTAATPIDGALSPFSPPPVRAVSAPVEGTGYAEAQVKKNPKIAVEKNTQSPSRCRLWDCCRRKERVIPAPQRADEPADETAVGASSTSLQKQ